MDSRYYHVTGLVLKHYTLGEHDRRVYFLIPGLGKIAAKARGAKKLTSPFTSRLSPLNVCDLMLYRTPANSWTVTQCQTQESFANLQNGLVRSSLALSIIDIAYRCTEEGHPSDMLLELTLETLRLMNVLEDESKCELLFQAYQFQTLDILGVLPSFSSCVRCHTRIELENLEGWHPLEILCNTCLANTNHVAYEIFDNNYLKLLNFIRRQPLRNILKVKIERAEQREISRILLMLWNAQTFSVPKSIGVLDSLHA
jgi:DNA repair protein RecO (recombination protein O)